MRKQLDINKHDVTSMSKQWIEYGISFLKINQPFNPRLCAQLPDTSTPGHHYVPEQAADHLQQVKCAHVAKY